MFTIKKKFLVVILVFPFLLIVLSSCHTISAQELEQYSESTFREPTLKRVSSTHTSTPLLISTPTPTHTNTKTIVTTLTPAFSEPEECLKPEDNYELTTINGMLINQRTYSMLEYAQTLYKGEIELTGYHITQGSYSNQVSASFGTHAGGGAVDISVIQYGTYQVLFDDIDPLINALRLAGFAAWLRDLDQLYPGSPIHIHAIAIGDRDLSNAAEAQLSGEFGYFRGYNGIPQSSGVDPVPDEHGGPILCGWMQDMGYSDLRTVP